MSPNTRPAVVVLIALAVILLIGCSSAPGESAPTGGVLNPSAVSAGRETFAANCAVCHGTAGQGQPNWHIKNPDGTLPAPPLNGDGHTWHHADGLLYRIVSQGGAIPELPDYKSGMPAFGEQLSRQEIIAVLTYVKGLWGDKTKRGLSIRKSQAQVSEQDPFPSQ